MDRGIGLWLGILALVISLLSITVSNASNRIVAALDRQTLSFMCVEAAKQGVETGDLCEAKKP